MKVTGETQKLHKIHQYNDMIIHSSKSIVITWNMFVFFINISLGNFEDNEISAKTVFYFTPWKLIDI